MQVAQSSSQLQHGHESESRPGLTSLVRTGRGLMTVQTELVGEPAQLVTIVDFRGRVLKTWKSPFALAPDDHDAPEQIRRWHQEIEVRVREKLAALARRRPQGEATGVVVGHLFIAAMQAYCSRDLRTAYALLRSCDLLMPDEPRIRAALERVRRR